jgi:hypothetical protein
MEMTMASKLTQQIDLIRREGEIARRGRIAPAFFTIRNHAGQSMGRMFSPNAECAILKATRELRLDPKFGPYTAELA